MGDHFNWRMCVMVAQQNLTLLVAVRVRLRLPFLSEYKMSLYESELKKDFSLVRYPNRTVKIPGILTGHRSSKPDISSPIGHRVSNETSATDHVTRQNQWVATSLCLM